MLVDSNLDTGHEFPSSLVLRDDANLNSAQAGCWSAVPGDMKLVFSDDVLAMITYLAADDFPYDLSIEAAEVKCALAPTGTCDHCFWNLTNVEVKYATENSWCYFLFTSEYGGTGYESFYVHWYQGVVRLHNPGFVKIVMCHDEDESRRKREIAAPQSGCDASDDSFLLEFGMGSEQWSTNIPSDGKEYKLGQPNPDLKCSPKNGDCHDCTDQAEYLFLRHAPEGSQCDLLFTETIHGGYIFGLTVNTSPYPVQMEKPGVLAKATCRQPAAASSKQHNSTSGRDDIISQTGCDSDPDSFELALGMGLNSFSTYVPADGQHHRLGQHDPELRCASFGGCNNCNDQATYVHLKSGTPTSHCDLLFTENIDGGYAFSVSITKEQYRIDLPQPGVLAMATCFKPGQRVKNWISKLQTPPSTNNTVSSLDVAAIPTTHSPSVRENSAGCNGPQDSSHVQIVFGNDGFNFSTWIPIDRNSYKMGQPEPQLYCQRIHKDSNVCADCWSPLSWIYFPKVDKTPDCAILLSDDLNGGGMLQLDIQTSPIVYRLQHEYNLVTISCSPADTASGQVARDISLAARGSSDERLIEAVSVGEGHQGIPTLGFLAPLALIPLVV